MVEPWYKDFFSTEYGLAVLDRKDKLTQVADFVIQVARLKPGDSVYDQCCGVGSLSLALAEKNITTTGCDINPEYINLAKQAALDQELSCQFVCNDAFEYSPPTGQAAVVNWYTSFGYGNDQQNLAMAEKAYQCLRPGGYFIIDFLNLPHLLRHFQPVMQMQRTLNGEPLKIKRETTFDFIAGRFLQTWHYTFANGNTQTLQGGPRMYMPHDISGLLRQAGFINLQLYGDIQKQEYNIDSPRCIVIGQVPE